MFSLGSYVNDAVKGLNAQKAIEFHRLREAWMLAVGPLLAGQAEPTKLRGGVLYVTVSSPAWSQEIQMQQRLILDRLKSTMGKAPTKIACWVGQPHLASGGQGRSQKRKVTEEDKVAWASVTIPAHRQAAIEATLAELADDAQREKLRPLIELSVRRELYYLDLGQLPCAICGAMRPAEDDWCPTCRREKLEEGERKLTRVMARKPWLKIRDLQDLAPWAGRGHILRLRKALHANLLLQAWQLSEGTEGDDLTKRMTPAYRKLLVSITQLRCYLPEDSLKPYHFQLALGKRLATSYLASLAEANGPS
jgi:hypothetical protein